MSPGGARRTRSVTGFWDALTNTSHLGAVHHPADLLPLQLPDPDGADDDDGHLADQRLRAGRRQLGGQARGRPRPGGGEGGGAADRQPVDVGRGVRAGGRTPRARHPVPRRAGHRQDDAGQGDRDRVQLAVRDDPGLGVRPDVHRRRRADRPLPGAQGEAAGGEVGRPVHRLHRRDRRGRHAPRVAGRVDDPLDHGPLRRPLLLRAERLAHPHRRPDPRDPRLARPDVRAARLGRRALRTRPGTRSSPESSTRRSREG